MSWIESHQELARHPKTKRLARFLGVSTPAAIGHLHLVWWWAVDYAPSGNLAPLSRDDIAEAGMWDGEPDVFIDALVRAGFLENDWQIHDWDEYAGRLIERRKSDSERLKAWREKHTGTKRVRNAYETDNVVVPDLTGPYLTGPDRTGPDMSASPPAPALPEARVFGYYRARIQPKARVDGATQIRARLKSFKEDELHEAIDHFAADEWQMATNASQGAPWFFKSDQHIEHYLNMTPRTEQSNGSRINGVRASAAGTTEGATEAAKDAISRMAARNSHRYDAAPIAGNGRPAIDRAPPGEPAATPV